MLYISDEKNDPKGEKGDIYVILYDENDFRRYAEIMLMSEEELEKFLGLTKEYLLKWNTPFCLIDDRVYLFRQSGKIGYTVLARELQRELQ